MSSFSETTRHGNLTSGTGSILGKYDNSPDTIRTFDARGALLPDLHDDLPVILPDVIGDSLYKPSRINDPSIADEQAKPARKKRKPKKKKASAKKKSRISARRGIDSLLRNAYRAQLDMLSLAAVKANIMISLNGLLISMLIISGTHIIGIDIWFAIPIFVFLISSATATIFAVLAARPDVSRKRFSPEDFNSDKAHLLAFEEFSDLNEEQYVEQMSNMLEDDDRVYKNMISHVHELGSTADRKYRNLYYSYSVFIGGIIVSIMTLLILEGMKWTNHLPLV